MNIRGNDSAEQKKRLEKKRGMKLDDHPQFKKEEVDPEKSKKIRKKLPHMGTGNPHYDAKSAGSSRVKDFKFTPVKEAYSSWRNDLSEVMTDDISDKPIKEKKVSNTVKINPKLGEASKQWVVKFLKQLKLMRQSMVALLKRNQKTPA